MGRKPNSSSPTGDYVFPIGRLPAAGCPRAYPSIGSPRSTMRRGDSRLARVTPEIHFSIIQPSQRTDSSQRDYDALVREAGYQYHPPGIHERDLPDLVKPNLVIPVGPFHEVAASDTVLEEFEQRSYSCQWEVPEDVHRQSMARLRKTWGGKEYRRVDNLEVTCWRIDRLGELARAAPKNREALPRKR